MKNEMDNQLTNTIIEVVNDKERIKLLKEILRYEKAKLGKSHRRGKKDKFRDEIQNCLKKKGEIL